MSGFSDLLTTIGKVAPLLASILPIPGAGIIGQVIATAFGGDINKPTELSEMIAKDPNAAIKLAEIESNMRVQLEQIAATNLQNNLLAEKARLDAGTANLESDRLDRSSARELGKLSNMPALVSFIILVGFFLITTIIMFFPLTNKESNIMFLLFGTIASAFASVVSYWLGSSAGSKSKDDTMLQLTTATQEVAQKSQANTIKMQAQTVKNTQETAKSTAETAENTADDAENSKT